jgi:hypothetical protein
MLFGLRGLVDPRRAVHRLKRSAGRRIITEVTIKRGTTTRLWDRNQVNIMREIKNEFGDHD